MKVFYILQAKVFLAHNTILRSVVSFIILFFWIVSLNVIHFVGDDVKEKKPDPSIYLTAVKVVNVAV